MHFGENRRWVPLLTLKWCDICKDFHKEINVYVTGHKKRNRRSCGSYYYVA